MSEPLFGESTKGLERPPLWGHQADAIARLVPLKGGILEAGLGAGKTRTALEYARRLGARRILVCSPLGSRVQWQEQIARWCPELQVLDLMSGTVRERDDRLRQFGDGLVLVNYDVLIPYPSRATLRARQTAAQYGASLLTPPETFTRQTLASWIWGGVMICDEVHHLRSPGGKHAKACAALGVAARRRLGMSGTPLPSKPLDAWSILRFAAPGVLSPSYTLFKRRYTYPVRREDNPQVIDVDKGGGLHYWRYRDLDDLRERLASVTYTCDGAPEILVIDAVMNVELEPAVMRFYRRYDRDLTAVLNDQRYTAGNALTKVMRLQQITGGALPEETGAEPQPVSTAKRRALEEWMESLPSVDEPAVVFCRFVADLAAVHVAAQNTGRSSLEVSGERKELERWRAGEGAILAAQVQSAGESVELHRAHYAAFYSLTRGLGEYRQARGRLPRPDQQHAWVHYTHLIATGTVDEEVYAGFQRGEDVLEALYQRRKHD